MSSSQLAIAQTYTVYINGNSTASKAKKPSHGSHSISVNGNTLPRIIAILLAMPDVQNFFHKALAVIL